MDFLWSLKVRLKCWAQRLKEHSKPILGADFLEKSDLRIDVKKSIPINKTQTVRVVDEGKTSADV